MECALREDCGLVGEEFVSNDSLLAGGWVDGAAFREHLGDDMARNEVEDFGGAGVDVDCGDGAGCYVLVSLCRAVG